MSMSSIIHNLGRVTVYEGDVRASLAVMPKKSVHVVVTSPPYWQLRSYLAKDDPRKHLELGSERTPDEFVSNLVGVFDGVREVLRDDGVVWVNLGDSYSGGGNGAAHYPESSAAKQLTNFGSTTSTKPNGYIPPGLQAGDQVLIPHRFALAMQRAGWLLRDTVIWAKRCLSGGTTLYARTKKGDMPTTLKDLVRLRPETVKLWDGEKWTRVVGWHRTAGEGTHLEIELRSGERIGCTGTHRWPTTNGEKTGDELKVGDVLLTRTLPEPDAAKRPSGIPDDIGWLVGFYIAEGHCADKSVQFSIHSNETAYFEKVKAIAERYGASATLFKRDGNASTIRVHGKVFRALLLQYTSGESCYNKRLSNAAWMRSNTFLREVLQGYLDGDGGERSGDWRLGFCDNRGLVSDLRTLGARLGASVRLKRVTHVCGDKKFKGWRGSVTFQPRRTPDGTIVAIRQSRARKFYDVEVADKPNWFCLASGVVSHNSPMPQSVRGWAWEKCRVKVNGQKIKRDKSIESANGHRGNVNPDFLADYADCPGCPKCRDTGGLVLRRGSWRHTSSFEYVFMFAKTGDYFSDGEAAQEPAEYADSGREDVKRGGFESKGDAPLPGREPFRAVRETRNPRNVWTLSNEPSSLAHFAGFPREIPLRCLKSAPSKVCSACGAPHAPVVSRERIATRPGTAPKAGGDEANRDPYRHVATSRITGYLPTCDCGAEVGRPVVLDIFGGTGTVAEVGVSLGMDAVLCELNAKYVQLIRDRLGASVPLFVA